MKTLLRLLLVLAMCTSAFGLFTPPETVPVDRLLSIGHAAVKADPKSAEAHYTLARIHFLAFACSSTELKVYLPREAGESANVGPFQRFTNPNPNAFFEEAHGRALKALELTEIPRSDMAKVDAFFKRRSAIEKELRASGWHPDNLPDAKASEHIRKAIDHFQAAQNLDGKNALYQLGYASLLEQATQWRKRHPSVEVPKEVSEATPATVRGEYLKAWKMELKADLADKGRGAFNTLDMVSYEAAKAYIRLAEKEKLGDAETKTLNEVKASLEELAEGRMNLVTPLIFSTHPVAGIHDLLAPEKTVGFPLRGWGPAGRWQWIKPETGLLVWNPNGSGIVASGAQLFGGYTWELFWKNGYEPLAVLDADGDGSLRGAELHGISAWFDRDSDGISAPGEVVTLSSLGVTALAVHPQDKDGKHLKHSRGITFSDGRVLPTWDWMAEPASQQNPGREGRRSLASP